MYYCGSLLLDFFFASLKYFTLTYALLFPTGWRNFHGFLMVHSSRNFVSDAASVVLDFNLVYISK
jgi:hypothetical protein